MRPPRPVAAAVLTFLGGFFVLLGGAFQWLFLSLLSFFKVLQLGSAPLWAGLIIGALLLLMALLMVAAPSTRIAWGVITLLLGFLSIPFASIGGFVVGFFLCLFGGGLAIFARRHRRLVGFDVTGGSAPPQQV